MVCQLCESVPIVTKCSPLQGCLVIEEACYARVAILHVSLEVLAPKVNLWIEMDSFFWK